MRTVLSLCLILLLAACAMSNPVLQEARQDVLNGRGEEALAKLDKAAREHPDQREYRVEYVRTRDFLASQLITQAEILRGSDRLEAAAALYLKVQKYDPENQRARAGLAQLEIDARHRGVVAEAQKLLRDEKYLEAQDLLRPVLNENPQQREARRIQRVIEEKTTKPAIVTPRLKSNNTQPISLELRDVQLRSVFDVISRNSGVSFVLDKDVRADQRTTIVLRNAHLEDLIRLV